MLEYAATTLRWLRRRTRYVVLLATLGTASVVLIQRAAYTEDSYTQGLLLNLGAGLTTVVLTYFVLNPLFEQVRAANTYERPRLDQRQYLRNIADCTRTVRILETWTPLLNDVHRVEFTRALNAAIRNGARVEILLLNPDSHAARQRTDELDGTDVRTAILSNLAHLQRFRSDLPEQRRDAFAVRVYSTLPSVQLYQWDGQAFISFFPISERSEDAPQLETQLATPWGDFVRRKFDEIWADTRTETLDSHTRLGIDVRFGEDDATTAFDVEYVRVGDRLFVADPIFLGRVTTRGTAQALASVRDGRAGDDRVQFAVELLTNEPDDTVVAVFELFQAKYGRDSYSRERDVVLLLAPRRAEPAD